MTSQQIWIGETKRKCEKSDKLDYVPSPCMLQGVNLPCDILVISRHFEPQRFQKNISHNTKYFHPPI